MTHDRKQSESGDTGPRKFKTRRSEIISGLTLFSLLSGYYVLRDVSGDIHEIVEAKNAVIEKRLERIESVLAKRIDELREDSKESDAELKQRIIWIERALNQRD